MSTTDGVNTDTAQLNLPNIVRSSWKMMEWNNFAISFKSNSLRVHINGVKIAETSIKYQFLKTSLTCVIGNNQTLNNPFHGHMRHLVFSKEGFDSSQSIVTKIRAEASPSDKNILAYFKF